MRNYLTECIERYPMLEVCRTSIQAGYDMLEHSFQKSGKVLLCGNGGSAADADHISGELLKGFALKRNLKSGEHTQLDDELYQHLQGGLRALPLTKFTALKTAFSNDGAPYYEFAQLVWVLGDTHDVLWCLSTSGKAKNVINAAKVARAKGMKILALTGMSGGDLKSYVDVCICVPEIEVFKIQELHLPVYHTISLMLEQTFFS